jgi:hypothetical protein
VEVQPGPAKNTVTQGGYSWMPSPFGGPDGHYAILHLKPLAAGKRYELSLTFNAGTDIGYSTAWVDGDSRHSSSRSTRRAPPARCTCCCAPASPGMFPWA